MSTSMGGRREGGGSSVLHHMESTLLTGRRLDLNHKGSAGQRREVDFDLKSRSIDKLLIK